MAPLYFNFTGTRSLIQEETGMFFRKLLHCSFCGKNETEVSKLVAGPRVYICNECASIVSRIIDGSHESPAPSRIKSSRLQRNLLRLVDFIRRRGSGAKYQISIAAYSITSSTH